MGSSSSDATRRRAESANDRSRVKLGTRYLRVLTSCNRMSLVGRELPTLSELAEKCHKSGKNNLIIFRFYSLYS